MWHAAFYILPKPGWAIAHPTHPPVTPLSMYTGLYTYKSTFIETSLNIQARLCKVAEKTQDIQGLPNNFSLVSLATSSYCGPKSRRSLCSDCHVLCILTYLHMYASNNECLSSNTLLFIKYQRHFSCDFWENVCILHTKRSVNFKMSFWCHRLDQNTNEKFDKFLP